mmetsp:Transcript_126577/g.248136  ORF Transcript_126577/g.248136 Transcript_126577/m.248136 type:complete len:296 (-) Transcript_126577:507-1394(-)
MSSKKHSWEISSSVPAMCANNFSPSPSATLNSSPNVPKNATNLSLLKALAPPAASLNICSGDLSSADILALMAVTASKRRLSVSAKARFTAVSFAWSTAEATLSARSKTLVPRCFSRGNCDFAMPSSAESPSQASSACFVFSVDWSTRARASVSAASKASAFAFKSSADRSVSPRTSPLASASAEASELSACVNKPAASSTIFCTACFRSSSSFFRFSSSARMALARTSLLAMATFWNNDRNLSKLTGSKDFMILSSTSFEMSNSNCALLKATTSARLNFPSESLSCLAKSSLSS